MKRDSPLLSMPAEEYAVRRGLSARARNGVVAYFAHYRREPATVADLAPAVADGRLARLRNVGQKTLAELRASLDADGLLPLREPARPGPSKRDQEIARLFAEDGLSFREIAPRYHLTPERIRQIVRGGAV